MNPSISSSLLVTGAVLLVGAGIRQLTVPNVEEAQTLLFKGFDELDRLDAYIVGADGDFLGEISKGISSKALANQYGAGNPFKSDGLFNEYGKYGSEFGSKSAFCKYATDPPKIIVKHGGDIYSVGLLTLNSSATTRGQKISPILLKAWLETK